MAPAVPGGRPFESSHAGLPESCPEAGVPFVHFVGVNEQSNVLREHVSTILINNIVDSASASHSPQDHSHIYSSSIDSMYTNSRQTG